MFGFTAFVPTAVPPMLMARFPTSPPVKPAFAVTGFGDGAPAAAAVTPVPCAMARLPNAPFVLASAFLPLARAKLKAPPFELTAVLSVAPLSSPYAPAPSKTPVAFAVVLGPIPTAKLSGPLVQLPPPELPVLMPLIDAQFAVAVPAPLSAAAAKPDATAPSSTPPANVSCDFVGALCVPIGVSPFQDLDGHRTP